MRFLSEREMNIIRLSIQLFSLFDHFEGRMPNKLSLGSSIFNASYYSPP